MVHLYWGTVRVPDPESKELEAQAYCGYLEPSSPNLRTMAMVPEKATCARCLAELEKNRKEFKEEQ